MRLTEWNQRLFLQASGKFLGASLLLELAVMKEAVSAHRVSRSRLLVHIAFISGQAITGIA